MYSPKAKAAARLCQMLWGFPQNLLGCVLWLVLRGAGSRYEFRTSWVCEWGLPAGFTAGSFVFVPKNCARSLLLHEYGHVVQSLILGPLYLPVIALPSLIWAGLPAFARMRQKHGYSYYRLYCERWANRLAYRITKEFPEGWY